MFPAGFDFESARFFGRCLIFLKILTLKDTCGIIFCNVSYILYNREAEAIVLLLFSDVLAVYNLLIIFIKFI